MPAFHWKRKREHAVKAYVPYLYGGRQQVPGEVYHSAPEAWEADTILWRHRTLGGTFDLRVAERPNHPPWSASQRSTSALYRVADGVAAGDLACVEMAVRYIEERHIRSRSGYIRRLMARRLKHVPLTGGQRRRLASHFLALLARQEKCQEFGDYIRLWRRCVTEEVLCEVADLTRSDDPELASFARHVHARLDGTAAGITRREVDC